MAPSPPHRTALNFDQVPVANGDVVLNKRSTGQCFAYVNASLTEYGKPAGLNLGGIGGTNFANFYQNNGFKDLGSGKGEMPIGSDGKPIQPIKGDVITYRTDHGQQHVVVYNGHGWQADFPSKNSPNHPVSGVSFSDMSHTTYLRNPKLAALYSNPSPAPNTGSRRVFPVARLGP